MLHNKSNIPVFCQFLQDQPTLSKHQMVYHHTRPHPILSNELEDDRPNSHCVLAVPSEATPITVLLPQDSGISEQIETDNNNNSSSNKSKF